ncbi:MAG: preprotein translocase subunit SecG [Candidatus Obscuribacterales bacterium]|nr:preprotein translocase subunit SecG [Candidatus Obscuribacterales bacterium]
MSPLYITLLALTTILALGIIVLILLHSPKGEGLGGIGGTASMFSGKRGAEAGLDRLTWGFSIAFLLCCLVLGFGFVK